MRNSCAANRTVFAIALVLTVFTVTGISAHRRDEYLQASRIAIDAGRVTLELDLTAGIAIADSVIADIDRDGDGVFSPEEQRTYAATALSTVELEDDGRRLRVQPQASTFPDVAAMRRGEGTIRLQSRAIMPAQSSGEHQLFYRNNHRRDVGVYLANAMVPESDRFAVSAQRRDNDQRELTINYVVRAGPAPYAAAWLLLVIAGVLVIAGLLPQRMLGT